MRIFKIIMLLLLFSFITVTGQRVQEALKRQALKHMNNGTYGEAIDLLNKYVAANAQVAEGYNLRGLCHEKRGTYQFAVLDFRRAIRLEPDNADYKKNLERARRDWNTLLYQKIEGHKREIAIDPSNPFNYLEIGKSYRWLEEWAIAEMWYDEYLARYDDASPDDIIRYTEILSHTGSIKKGEIILKKYVKRYPDDWRLWSRYGYFTMWLGNYRPAEQAFLNALNFKPFFKEAQDGLDIARNQGYMVKQSPRSFEREYPIDRYYRILKNNPQNIDARFSLVDELIAAERYEEAYKQLKEIKEEYEGTARFDELYTKVTGIRETVYSAEIDKNLIIIKEDPTNREAIIELAKYLSWLERYDEADEILAEYLELQPGDSEVILLRAKYLSWNENYDLATELLLAVLERDPFNKEVVEKTSDYFANDYDYDRAIEILNTFLDRYPATEYLDLRFKLARYYAWNYNWEDARDELDNLLALQPNNLDYQLLRAQVSVWTVDDTEFEMAETYLNNVLTSEPSNLNALLGLATIRAWQGQLEEAKKYIDLAKQYHAGNPEITTTENFYNAQLLVKDEKKYAGIRKEGGELAQAGDCDAAVDKYEEYLSLVDNPDRFTYKEYASALMCAQEYPKAIETYTQLLNDGYEFDVALNRAKAYLWSLDTTSALMEFQKLYEEDPEDFQVRMFLGDAYALNKDYGEAEDLYYELIDETDDEEEIDLLNQKIDLIPLYGFRKGVTGLFYFILPYNIGIVPFADYYTDNQDLVFYNYGGRMEMGLMRYFSIGADWKRTQLESGSNDQFLTGLRGNIYFHPVKNLSIGGGYGKLNIQGEDFKYFGNILARYEERNKVGITVSYEDDDARRVLYSPMIIYNRLDVFSYIFNAYYVYRENIKFRLNYRYNKVTDGNKGNDFTFGVGKLFRNFIYVGYEYTFSDYALDYQDALYYSPQEFATHSLWGEIEGYNIDEWNISLTGKIGYAPSIDFVVSSITADIKYEIVDQIIFQSRTGYGNSFRYDSNYSFFSQLFSLYWNIF